MDSSTIELRFNNYFDKESTDLLADIAVPDGANLRNPL
jgi:hypothetical protein